MTDQQPDPAAPSMERNTCRFYENKYPGQEELVVVQVKSVDNIGAYVQLLEYNNIEGMILLSELTRRRIRSVNKLIRVGQIQEVITIRVDEEKGYVDLSKRRVSPEDSKAAQDKFNNSKAVHSLIRHVSDTCNVPMIELYETFAWDLYKRYGHAYQAFTMAVRDEESVLGQYNLPENIRTALMTTVRRKMTPQPIKIRAFFDLQCFTYEGIDAIKVALRCAEAEGPEDTPVKVSLIAPPEYVITATTLQLQEGVDLLNLALAKATASVRTSGGSLVIKVPPKAVSAHDEVQLADIMEKLAASQKQREGESDEDDDQ